MKRFIEPLRISHMLIILWIVVFAVDAAGLITDPDIPWHITTGAYILQHHAVPTSDPFSWSMHGMPWVTQEWLFEVALAWMSLHLGFFGYWTLIVIIHAFTVVLIYETCRRIPPFSRVGASIVACLATMVGWPFWVVRPQIISYAFFALMLLILVLVQQGKFRALWFVPFITILWANSHSSVSIGLSMLLFDVIISFLPTLGRLHGYKLPQGARWRLLLTAVISAGCAILNPNGLKEITYAFLSSNSLMVSSINEWHSPDFHSTYYKYGVLLFFLFCTLILAVSKRQVSMRHVFYFIGTFALTLIYQRFAPYFALASALLVVEIIGYLGMLLDEPSKIMRGFCGVIILVSAGLFVSKVRFIQGSVESHFSKTAYPVNAVHYLLKHPIQGRLLNAYNFGGYLIYSHIPTFVDGRTDIFLQNHVFEDYMDLQNLNSNAPIFLDNYQFSYALLPPNYAISVYLSHDPNWRVIYQDGIAEIFIRTHHE